LTKLHEEMRRDSLAALASHYASGGETRGEFVIVIAPPDETALAPSAEYLDGLLRRTLGEASLKDAVSIVAEATGQPRREIYQRALALAKSDGAQS
jgi:16S rRNA (cytidine1402-2'-O)-methyltransferase